MSGHSDIVSCVHAAIDTINEELDDHEKIGKADNSPLFGPDGTLDSLSLISFITTLEEELEERTGLVLSLYDDSVMNGANDPFREVGSLVEHVSRIVAMKNAA